MSASQYERDQFVLNQRIQSKELFHDSAFQDFWKQLTKYNIVNETGYMYIRPEDLFAVDIRIGSYYVWCHATLIAETSFSKENNCHPPERRVIVFNNDEMGLSINGEYIWILLDRYDIVKAGKLDVWTTEVDLKLGYVSRNQATHTMRIANFPKEDN